MPATAAMLEAETAARPRADADGDVQRLTELRDQWQQLDQRQADLEDQLAQLEDEKDQVKNAGRQVYEEMDEDTADRVFDELSPDNWE